MGMTLSWQIALTDHVLPSFINKASTLHSDCWSSSCVCLQTCIPYDKSTHHQELDVQSGSQQSLSMYILTQ